MENGGLAGILARQTRKGTLYEKLADRELRCYCCGHYCVMADDRQGICKVRFNQGGELFVPWGYVAGLQDDPIEKKPFYHALPGARALSFGMLGCDFHCSFCQNWISSQALRDFQASSSITKISPREIIRYGIEQKCQVITSTYNEPLITSEWAVEIFKLAKAEGFITAYVSNGNASQEVLDYLRPWLDLFKIDLKCFDDKHYRELGGKLETICQTIRQVSRMGFWMEVVTLLIPGYNDSKDELSKLADFLVSVSPDIPWHVTAFHRDYKMIGPRNTSPQDLLHAYEIGKKAGLNYIYAGNLPGRVREGENTYCHHCGECLIERFGFQILKDELSPRKGQCLRCQTFVPGFWFKK
ncbi:MAG: AmmeMemoRadiSam system radical SAM enzyme [Candidatus Omnitrophica bacterium]|nr:AmmeMemoRadiSam system radical SAM enzyme [Candidatus Omnitrophota bacterium]